MSDIALLIPYFGTLPDYTSLYLKSLQRHPTITMYLISDKAPTCSLPSNAKFVEMTKEEIARRVKQLTGANFNIQHPIKLCDIRPAYGEVFQDIIEPHTHWAFGDLDVIYGQLFSFLPKDWAKYDVVSMLPHWLSGSFCIFKNKATINSIYRESDYWKQAFESEEHVAFDECNRLYDELRAGANILEIDDKQSFTYIVKRAQQQGRLTAYFSPRIIKEKIFRFEKIHVTDEIVEQKTGRDFAYYHLISEKSHPQFKVPTLDWNELPDGYVIDKSGLHKLKDYQRLPYRLQKSVSRSFYHLKHIQRRVNRKLSTAN